MQKTTCKLRSAFILAAWGPCPALSYSDSASVGVSKSLRCEWSVNPGWLGYTREYTTQLYRDNFGTSIRIPITNQDFNGFHGMSIMWMFVSSKNSVLQMFADTLPKYDKESENDNPWNRRFLLETITSRFHVKPWEGNHILWIFPLVFVGMPFQIMSFNHVICDVPTAGTFFDFFRRSNDLNCWPGFHQRFHLFRWQSHH